MKVLLRGPLLTNSGYGVHSRQLFEWLYEKKEIELYTECTMWGRCAWIINPESEDGLIGKIMSCSKNSQNIKFDMTYQVQLPNEWDSNLGKVNIGVTAAVETNLCNAKWIESCNKMDAIIVPSVFTRNVLKRSGVLFTKVYVINEWFNHHILNKSSCDKILAKDKRYKFNTNFNILIMGLLTSMNIDEDRKNLMNTIKWSLETFKDNKDVGIVIKTSIGKSTESDKLSCTQIIKNFIKEHRPGEFPKINLIHGNLTSKEIAALFHHNKIKMFISGTRGEGYGLPLADAAAAGIPIVVTGWSGCFDFLDKELVSPVKYNMVEVPKNKIDGEIFVENTKWANPDENDFKFKLNNVYKDYKAYKEKAKVLQKNIHHKINKNFIKKKYDEFLKEVLTIV